MVIPQTHDKNHAISESLAESRHATVLREDILVSKGLLLGCAEVRVDGVAGDTADIRLGVGDDYSVLDVESLDLAQSAAVGSIGSDELRDDSHLGVGVDDLSGAEEASVAHAVWVEVTSIGVTGTCVALGGVSATAVVTFAHGLSGSVTRVGSQGSRDAVGFPDVKLCTARAVVTNSRVGVGG